MDENTANLEICSDWDQTLYDHALSRVLAGWPADIALRNAQAAKVTGWSYQWVRARWWMPRKLVRVPYGK